jgi:phosphoribosylformylglycinamidine synthase subunit PurS
MFKMGVRIMPRAEVLDTQGRAVEMTLKQKGFTVDDCKVGRYVVLNIDSKNKTDAETQAKKISESLLCNMLIETYQVEELP